MSEVVPLAESIEVDVFVAGGGVAGVFAALAAARRGARVLLVEFAGYVGGQGTRGGVHTFCGDTENVNDDWDALMGALGQFDGGVAPFRPNDDGRSFSAEHLKFAAQGLLESAGVEVLLHSRVIHAVSAEDRVEHVLVAGPGGIVRVHAAQFVDATGDADVAFAAGAETESGGRSFSPTDDGGVQTLADRLRLPMSLYFALVDTGRDVVPTLPPGGPQWEGDDDLPMTSVYHHEGLVVVKMKVVGFSSTDVRSLSRAEQAARLQALALVHHLQTRGYRGRRYTQHRLAWIAPHIGVREGRRIRARRALTLDDLLTGTGFDDAVAVGSYHIDYHWPADVRRAGTGLTGQVPPYQIPLRALRPVGLANIVVPGRSVGGEQIAMSSYRVMGTCAQTGFAAGTVAGMAARSSSSLDDLDAGEVRVALRESGVRLDRAPYLRYLRARRAAEHVVPASYVTGVDVALSPDGAIIVASVESGAAVIRWISPDGAVLGLHRGIDADLVSIRTDDRRVLPPGQQRAAVVEEDGVSAVMTVRRLDGAHTAFGVDLAEGVLGSGVPAEPCAPRDTLSIDSAIFSPGVPEAPLHLRWRGRSIVAAGVGRHVDVADEAPSSVALSATAAGILAAWVTADGIGVRHIPFDEFTGEDAGHPDNERHTGLEWTSLLRDAGQVSWST